MAKVELNYDEGKYVDTVATAILSSMISKSANSYSSDYFKLLANSSYELALVMLAVKNEKVDAADAPTFMSAASTDLPFYEDVNWPLTEADVKDRTDDSKVVEKKTKAKTKVTKDKKATKPKKAKAVKRGRPKGSKNLTKGKKGVEVAAKPTQAAT